MVLLSVASSSFKCIITEIARRSKEDYGTTNFVSSSRICISGSVRSKHFGNGMGWLWNSDRPKFPRSASYRLSDRDATAREVYQPYRPPATVVPGSSSGNLSIEEQLEILRERRGLWHEYAAYVPLLYRAGFSPSMVDEATGLTGVEQNKIVVASQVRSSLKSSAMDESSLAYFDVGGADVLYELRILSSEQRKSAAEYIIDRRMDPKNARDLARAVKDYTRRKSGDGWDAFSIHPGDCLAFACFRQTKECKNDEERENYLNKGLSYVISEKGRAKLLQLMERGKEIQEPEKEDRLKIIRLGPGEVADGYLPVLVPVVEPMLQEFEAAPTARALTEGPFCIQRSHLPWKSWVALPGWDPLTSSLVPIAIPYPHAGTLPWKNKGRQELEEPILLIVDKGSKELQQDSFFLVAEDGDRLGVQLGTVVSETGGKALGKVVLVLRPPLQQSMEFNAEDWE
eukprot:c29229_g1_i1 orf=453-1820(+)